MTEATTWRDRNPEAYKASQRALYHKHKEKRLAAAKTYREENREQYRERHKVWNKENPDVIKKASKKYKDRRRTVINQLKVLTGCQNPNCGWSGEFHPCDLDFHHINGDKIKSIALMIGSSIANLVKEINKCAVLCAICHRRATHGHLECGDFNTCCVTEAAFAADVLEAWLAKSRLPSDERLYKPPLK